MKLSRCFIALGAMACFTQPVLANDYLFRGDCDAADEFQRSLSIRDLMPRRSYTSVHLANFGTDTCGRSYVMITELTNKVTVSLRKMSFNVVRKTYLVDKTKGNCVDPEYSTSGNGTFTFEIKKFQAPGGKCDIKLKFSENVTYTNGRKSNAFGDVTPLNEHSFVLTQPDETGSGRFFTPFAFTANEK